MHAVFNSILQQSIDVDVDTTYFCRVVRIHDAVTVLSPTQTSARSPKPLAEPVVD